MVTAGAWGIEMEPTVAVVTALRTVAVAVAVEQHAARSGSRPLVSRRSYPQPRWRPSR